MIWQANPIHCNHPDMGQIIVIAPNHALIAIILVSSDFTGGRYLTNATTAIASSTAPAIMFIPAPSFQ
jgi:hypothetical protein